MPDSEHSEREFDIVLWGATGFTGQLVAEYLLDRYGTERFRWALGGRSRAKLEAVRSQLGEPGASLPVVVGDSADEAFMSGLAQKTRVVCTTVGPYAKYGTELVKACAQAGTHYCDLTGEVHWMRAMIDDHGEEASASGARIVFTCGFDSIPSDLGVYFVQQEMQRRHGVPCARAKLRVNGASGGASGGTIASMLNMMEEAKNDPEVMRVTNEPYAINPKDQRTGPDGPDARGPVYDEDFGAWTAPFMMAGINTKVVRRSNALLGYAYGKGFRYDEATLTGPGPMGLAKAAGVAAATTGGMVAMAIAPIRNAVAGRLPQPGEGPSPEAREAGYWDLSVLGLHPDDPAKNVLARLTGDRDPGYGSTAKMLGESAVCLAEADLDSPGGMLTPASAMGDALIDRLRERAGITFELEDAPSR